MIVMHLMRFLAKEKFNACIYSRKLPALIVECVSLDKVRSFAKIRNGDIYPPTTARVRTSMQHIGLGKGMWAHITDDASIERIQRCARWAPPVDGNADLNASR